MGSKRDIFWSARHVVFVLISAFQFSVTSGCCHHGLQ